MQHNENGVPGTSPPTDSILVGDDVSASRFLYPRTNEFEIYYTVFFTFYTNKKCSTPTSNNPGNPKTAMSSIVTGLIGR